jgi:hypothetical protein
LHLLSLKTIDWIALGIELITNLIAREKGLTIGSIDEETASKNVLIEKGIG